MLILGGIASKVAIAVKGAIPEKKQTGVRGRGEEEG